MEKKGMGWWPFRLRIVYYIFCIYRIIRVFVNYRVKKVTKLHSISFFVHV